MPLKSSRCKKFCKMWFYNNNNKIKHCSTCKRYHCGITSVILNNFLRAEIMRSLASSCDRKWCACNYYWTWWIGQKKFLWPPRIRELIFLWPPFWKIRTSFNIWFLYVFQSIWHGYPGWATVLVFFTFFVLKCPWLIEKCKVVHRLKSSAQAGRALAQGVRGGQ